MTTSRLSATHESLCTAIAEATPSKRAMAIIYAAKKALLEGDIREPDVDAALPVLASQDPALMSAMKPQLTRLAGESDEKYFALDASDQAASRKFFSVARVAAGLEFAMSLDSWSIQEALYELTMAVENPEVITEIAELALK